MIPSFINPYASNTYVIFRYIIGLYLLAAGLNVIFFLYPTPIYEEYRQYVLLLLTVLHLASFAVLLVIAEYSRQPLWVMWYLWFWFIWNIFFGLITLTEHAAPYLMKLYMMSGFIGFTYIFILFKVQDRKLGAYFRMLAASHLLIFAIKLMYQLLPESLEVLYSIAELLPIGFLLLLVYRTWQQVEREEMEEQIVLELDETHPHKNRPESLS